MPGTATLQTASVLLGAMRRASILLGVLCAAVALLAPLPTTASAAGKRPGLQGDAPAAGQRRRRGQRPARRRRRKRAGRLRTCRRATAAACLEHEAVHHLDCAQPLRARATGSPPGCSPTAQLDRNGVLHGSLYLQGAGDPALGSPAFYDRYLGGLGTNLFALKAQIARRRGAGRDRAGCTPTTRSSTASAASPTRVTRPAPTSAPSPGLAFNSGYSDLRRRRLRRRPGEAGGREAGAFAARGRHRDPHPGRPARDPAAGSIRSPRCARRRCRGSSTPPTSTRTTSSPRC